MRRGSAIACFLQITMGNSFQLKILTIEELLTDHEIDYPEQ